MAWDPRLFRRNDKKGLISADNRKGFNRGQWEISDSVKYISHDMTLVARYISLTLTL